jgi:RNA polymerase sigma factor (sigma-70 family)
MQEEKAAVASEKLLVEGCKNNDRKMQESLYRKFSAEMYSICLAYEDDRDKAKDILQDGFIKVFRNIGSFEFQGSLKAWVRKIITNTAIDHWRKNSKETGFFRLDAVASYDHPADEPVSVTDYSAIIDQVNKLPAGARIIFNLYALEGYSHKEIAARLNISEGTSKSQVNRARQLLHRYLSNFLDSDE